METTATLPDESPSPTSERSSEFDDDVPVPANENDYDVFDLITGDKNISPHWLTPETLALPWQYHTDSVA